jgi:hypothetical protein
MYLKTTRAAQNFLSPFENGENTGEESKFYRFF